MQALFGNAYVEDLTRYSDGRFSARHVERPRVRVDEWMNALEPGAAWLRIAPIDRGWRQERVRVALPDVGKQDSETGSETKAATRRDQFPNGTVGATGARVEALPRGSAGGEGGKSALPPVPPDCPRELVDKMGADILAKVERRWSKQRHELGPCLVWRDGEPTIKAAAGLYGRLYDATRAQ
jgi:hypothetical protein